MTWHSPDRSGTPRPSPWQIQRALNNSAYVFSNFFSNFWLIFWQTLRGWFSAVSPPNFASKYSFESSWRDLQDLHLCVFWEKRTEIENEIMKMYTTRFCTALHSTSRRKFVKHFEFRIFALVFYFCFEILVQNSQFYIFSEFSQFVWMRSKSPGAWDFATNILKFAGKWCSKSVEKTRKQLEKVRNN